MKKNVTKIALLLITLFAFYINSDSVSAALEVGNMVEIKHGEWQTDYNIYYQYQAGSGVGTDFYGYYEYRAAVDGKEYPAYCMDPGSIGGSGQKVVRIFPPGDGTSIENDATDYGALHILTSGKSYSITSVAIRRYMFAVGWNIKIVRLQSNMYSAFNGWYGSVYKFGSKDDSFYQADTLVKDALAERAKYIEDHKNKKDATESTPTAATEAAALTVTPTSNKNGNTEDFFYTFRFSNYESDKLTVELDKTDNSYFTFSDLSLCNSAKDDCESITSAQNIIEVGFNRGLIDKTQNSEGKDIINGTMIVKFTVTKTEGDACAPAPFTFKYTEYNGQGNADTTEYDKYLVVAYNPTKCYEVVTNGVKTRECEQRYMFVIDKDDLESVGTTPTPDGGVTTSLEGSVECAEVQCDTLIEMPECDDSGGEFAGSKITAPLDVKKCVIEKEIDDADNSYVAQNLGTYCKMYCKEDYASIQMTNVVKNVKCLGYFQLEAKIQGSKDCYIASNSTADKSIDKNGFIKKIRGYQKKMVAAYDDYLKNTRIAELINSTSAETEYYCFKGTESNPTTFCERSYSFSVSGYYSGYDYDENTGTLTSRNKSIGESIESKDSCYCKPGDSNSDCDTYYSIPYGYSQDESYNMCSGMSEPSADTYTRKATSAMAEYRKNEAELEAEIKDYQACFEADKGTFNYGAEIAFTYTEDRWESGLIESPYQKLVTDNNVLEKESNVSGGETRRWTNSSEADFSSFDSWSSGAAGSEQIQVVACSGGVCSSKSHEIRNAKDVKNIWTHFTVTAEYQTPTLYYQSYPTAKVGNKEATTHPDTFQFVELDSKLPTSAQLVGGGSYTLTLNKLGEFYDSKDSLGRLLDDTANSIGKKKGVSNKTGGDVWNGEFVCHYYSPCQPEECPACKFVCAGPDSCSWEDGCPTCEVKCSQTGCLINFGEVRATTKTVSLTALASQTNCKTCTNYDSKSNDFREFGYNWSINTSYPAFELIQKKAEETVKAIDKKNTEIYNDDTSSTSTSSDLAFSITLTPSMISEIQKYNEGQLKKGGYANDTLKCEGYKDSKDTEYPYVNCYSIVIDDWQKKYGSDVVFTPIDRHTSGYFTNWPNMDKKSDEVIGGPSWK